MNLHQELAHAGEQVKLLKAKLRKARRLRRKVTRMQCRAVSLERQLRKVEGMSIV